MIKRANKTLQNSDFFLYNEMHSGWYNLEYTLLIWAPDAKKSTVLVL